MSEIDAPIATIVTAHTAMETRASRAEAEKQTLLQTVATLTTERDTLKAKLAACEAAGGGGSVPEPPVVEPPVVEPPTTPTGTKPPAILNERFTNGVDWSRFYADSGGGPAAPKERFVKTAEGLKIIYIANNPVGTKRTELGIRKDVGGGETPRRDPIGSERWYAIDFMIPDAYKLDDSMADNKRVLWQAHQSGPGIVNPPLSLELRNGTLRLVRSVAGERDELLDPDSDPDGIVCVKGVWHKFLVHTLWHPTSGWVECWLDGLHKPKVNKKMCTASGDGLNCKIGSYQPGAASFPSGYRIEHLVRRWSIGDQTAKLEDFA